MKYRTRLLAGFSAVLLALIVTATATAYSGEVLGSITVAAHGNVRCSAPFTLTATILDANGSPRSGQSVVWTFVSAPSTSDRINKTTTVTNSHGIATTTVKLAPVSGTRRIRATAGDIRASAVMSPACGGLPSTSTLPTETVPALDYLVAMLLALAIIGGGMFSLRRLAATIR